MSIQRRKRIYGKRRRRKSPFRGKPPENYYESDYFETAKKGDYCPPQPKSMTDAEYSRYCELKGFKKPDFTTFDKPNENTTSLDTTVEFTDYKPVGGSPSFLPGPRTLKALKLINDKIDIGKELSNAWKQWMSGGTFRGRGND